MPYDTLNEDRNPKPLQDAAEALMRVSFLEPAPELGDGCMQYVHFLDIEEAWEYLEAHGPQRPLEYLEPEVASSKMLFEAWSAVVNFFDQNPGSTHARGADFDEEAGVGDLLEDWEHPADLQDGVGSPASPSSVQVDSASGITREEAQEELEEAQKRLLNKVAAMNALRRATAAWDEDDYGSSPFMPLPAWYSEAMKRARAGSPQ